MATPIRANSRLEVSDWGNERLQHDKRWQYGSLPRGNRNLAWMQHRLRNLAPAGMASFVLTNSSMSSERFCNCGRGGMFNDR